MLCHPSSLDCVPRLLIEWCFEPIPCGARLFPIFDQIGIALVRIKRSGMRGLASILPPQLRSSIQVLGGCGWIGGDGLRSGYPGVDGQRCHRYQS
jgi:hypothetical protein